MQVVQKAGELSAVLLLSLGFCSLVYLFCMQCCLDSGLVEGTVLGGNFSGCFAEYMILINTSKNPHET
jgi:hypothetical protein